MEGQGAGMEMCLWLRQEALSPTALLEELNIKHSMPFMNAAGPAPRSLDCVYLNRSRSGKSTKSKQ